MKRFAFIFAAFAACFAVSCNKEMPESVTTPTVQDGFKTVTITADIADADTKTSYDADGKFSWTKGDQISIMGNDYNFYTFTADETGATSTFTGVIPENITLRKEAFYPADSGIKRVGSDYFYSIPEYKDLSASFSADLPMGSYSGTETYSFLHMTGAALFTFTNIPNGIKAVEIAFTHTIQLSGEWSTWTESLDENTKHWTIGAHSADTESEGKFIRKVPVVNNQAQVYLPYPSDGSIWAGLKVSVTGFDASDNEIVLLTDRETKNTIAAIPRATVTPMGKLEVPDYLPLSVDWNNANVTTCTTTEGITELKVTADEDYLYIRFAAPKTFECDYLYYYILGGEGEASASWAWTSTGASSYMAEGPMSNNSLSIKYNGTSVGTNVTTEGDNIYWHMALPRNAHELTTAAGNIKFSVMAYVNSGFAGAAPSRWGEMLEVTLP